MEWAAVGGGVGVKWNGGRAGVGGGRYERRKQGWADQSAAGEVV